MGSMESFYGGRQGASFIIVKRFDGLDISENTIYRVGWFAQDSDGYFIVNSDGSLIEKTGNNYSYFYNKVTPIGTEDPSAEGWYEYTSAGYILTADTTVVSGKNYYERNSYSGWGTIPKDGITTVTSKSGNISNPLPLEYAEGMKQCFEKGGATTSAVGYGEYVIIDTISGLNEYDSPDNGKVYRRGMNYEGDLGGAEYIGRIVGPAGRNTELAMTTVADILTHPESQSREYIMTTGSAQDGIVPGKYEDGGFNYYNDDITYGWATVRDVYNNITETLIGFTFPYLIPEIYSIKRSPYYTQEDYDTGRITDPTLIGKTINDWDNFDLFVDNEEGTLDRDPNHGDTGHAFYRKWKLSVPNGIKGDTQTQLEIVPQKIRINADLWGSTDLTQPPVDTADNNTYVILNDDPFPNDCVYPYNDASAIVAVEKTSIPGVVYYAKIEDTYMLKFRYRQTWYDNHGDGSDYNIIDLGDYNTIRKIWLSNDGYLWASYNADEDGVINSSTPVSWIESVALANKNNPVIYDPEGTSVNAGHFRIIFNNDNVVNKTGTWIDSSSVSHAVWETDLTWPQSVSLDTNGLLKFLYNNNLYYDRSIYTDPVAGTYEFEIPWITNVLIQQNGTFTLSYNNEVNAGTYPPSEWNSMTHTWTTSLNFIDHVNIDNDGTIHFMYSSGGEAPNTGYLNIKLKYLADVNIRTGLNSSSIYDFDGEGSGDQKVELTWNTGVYNLVTPIGTEDPSAEGWYEFDGSSYILSTDTSINIGTSYYEFINDIQVIGAPLNYIMEAIVSTYDPKAPATPQNHLLVLYSDPAYRAWLATKYPTKIYSYTSQKFTEADPATPGGTRFVTRNDWFDLGYVKGEPGGLHIIGEYTLSAGQTYATYLDDTIPPEDMPGNTPDDRGWAYLITDPTGSVTTRTIYTYDYVHLRWTLVGDLSNVAVDPIQTVILDYSVIDPSTGLIIPANSAYAGLPKDKGLWFIEYDIKAAY